jgi:hypothetical protein
MLYTSCTPWCMWPTHITYFHVLQVYISIPEFINMSSLLHIVCTLQVHNVGCRLEVYHDMTLYNVGISIHIKQICKYVDGYSKRNNAITLNTLKILKLLNIHLEHKWCSIQILCPIVKEEAKKIFYSNANWSIKEHFLISIQNNQ